MKASSRKLWLRTVILLGVVYLVVGLAFGAFAGSSASNQMRVTWRLLAFLTSAIAFAIHIGYEHFGLGIRGMPPARLPLAVIAVIYTAFGILAFSRSHNPHHLVPLAMGVLLAAALAIPRSKGSLID